MADLAAVGVAHHVVVEHDAAELRQLHHAGLQGVLRAGHVVFGFLVFMEGITFFYLDHIDKIYLNAPVVFTYMGFEWMKPLPGIGMYLIFVAICVSGLMIMLGWKYRWSSWMFALLWTYVYFSHKEHYNNHHYLFMLVAYAMAFMPAADDFSLDVYFNPSQRRTTCPQWCVSFFIIQLLIVLQQRYPYPRLPVAVNFALVAGYAAVCLYAIGYLNIEYDNVSIWRQGSYNTHDFVVGLLMFVLVMEVSRQFHPILFWVNVGLVIYTLWGYLSPIDFFWHPGVTLERVVTSPRVAQHAASVEIAIDLARRFEARPGLVAVSGFRVGAWATVTGVNAMAGRPVDELLPLFDIQMRRIQSATVQIFERSFTFSLPAPPRSPSRSCSRPSILHASPHGTFHQEIAPFLTFADGHVSCEVSAHTRLQPDRRLTSLNLQPPRRAHPHGVPGAGGDRVTDHDRLPSGQADGPVLVVCGSRASWERRTADAARRGAYGTASGRTRCP